jgi:pyridoxamine 5'-phosphate oxidase
MAIASRSVSPRRPDLPPLRRDDLRDDPIAQFREWFERAEVDGVPLPEAMTLATVDEHGRPDARMVLLKGVDEAGFRFFTGHKSAKGRQLAAQPEASLVVYWRELDRQVRVRGIVERLPEAESDAYFAGRPREAQIGAWASPQSRPIGSRAELDQRVAEITKRFDGADVERPPHWGGYLLRPSELEFWQGQVGRLHDRFRYSRDEGAWRIERLGP